MTYEKIAEKWASQSSNKGKSKNLFFYNKIIYSYGYHFPIARIGTLENGDEVIFFSNSKASSSTSMHQSIVFKHSQSFPLIECDDVINFDINKSIDCKLNIVSDSIKKLENIKNDNRIYMILKNIRKNLCQAHHLAQSINGCIPSIDSLFPDYKKYPIPANFSTSSENSFQNIWLDVVYSSYEKSSKLPLISDFRKSISNK